MDKVKEIVAEINKGNPKPIYFLMGEEPYYIDRISQYIADNVLTEDEKGKQLEISLKYFDGKPAIKEISRISKPGMRVYSSVKNMPSFKNNMGISILSTSKGVMTNFSAQEANLGGEILCKVY